MAASCRGLQRASVTQAVGAAECLYQLSLDVEHLLFTRKQERQFLFCSFGQFFVGAFTALEYGLSCRVYFPGALRFVQRSHN